MADIVIHSDWLEWPDDRGPFRGRFPEGTLNAKQFKAIIDLKDRRYGRCLDVYEGRAFNKLTEEIIEAHFRIGISPDRTRHCVLWLDLDGRQLASAVVVSDDRKAESWWIPPEKLRRPWASDLRPIQMLHRHGMWSIGLDGAVALTRQFVHDNYVNVNEED